MPWSTSRPCRRGVNVAAPRNLEGLPWPDGEPGALRAGAARMAELGKGWNRDGDRLAQATGIDGTWQGTADAAFEISVGAHRDGLRDASAAFGAAAGVLSRLAGIIEEAQAVVIQAAARVRVAREAAEAALGKSRSAQRAADDEDFLALPGFGFSLESLAARSAAREAEAEYQRVRQRAATEAEQVVNRVEAADRATAQQIRDQAAKSPVAASVRSQPQSEEESSGGGAGGIVHGLLDVAGLVPLFGEPADLANCGFYAAEGKKVDAGLSCAGAIPFVGWGATAAKGVKRGGDAIGFVRGGSKIGKKAIREVFEEGLDDVSEEGLQILAKRQGLSGAATERLRRDLLITEASRRELVPTLDAALKHPDISPRASAALKKAKNALDDHLKPADLTGALRDRAGVPVLNEVTGQAFQHGTEVNRAVDSLTNARNALRRELDAGGWSSAELQAALDAVSETRNRIKHLTGD